MKRVVLVLVFAMLSLGLARESANYASSLAEVAAAERFEDACRDCHFSGVADRHHLLYDQAVIPDSAAPYPDANGDGVPDPDYGCLNCHDANLTVVRNCVACHVSPVGTVPDGSDLTEDPLTVTRAAFDDLTLNWARSCGDTDTDYAVYQGTLGDFADPAPILCSTEGATSATITPPLGSAFYLVIAQNHWSEGSYGVDGEGAQRPPSASACRFQALGCPWF